MDHILHNIALIILCTGIIFMTVYVTKASNNNFRTYQEEKMLKDSKLKRLYPKQNIYNYNVSDSYKNMFKDQTAWLGYQTFNPANQDFMHPRIY